MALSRRSARKAALVVLLIALVLVASVDAKKKKEKDIKTATKNKYKRCSKNADCKSSGASICLPVFSDPTALYVGQGNPIVRGVCVQCTQNCHCGVGQVCMPDITVGDVMNGFSLSNLATLQQKQDFDADLSAVKDLQMPSRCVPINKVKSFRKGKACNPLLDPLSFYQVGSALQLGKVATPFTVHYTGQSKTGTKTNVAVNILAYNTNAASPATNDTCCSMIANYQPAFKKCLGSACGTNYPTSTDAKLFNGRFLNPSPSASIVEEWSSGQGTAGQCSSQASMTSSLGPSTSPLTYDSSAGGQCSHALYSEAAKALYFGSAPPLGAEKLQLNFQSWVVFTNDLVYQGYCLEGKCRQCADGTSRCSINSAPYDTTISSAAQTAPSTTNTGSNGQVCIRGEWKEFWYNDATYRTIPANATAGATAVTAVFVSFVFVIVLAFAMKSCILQLRKMYQQRFSHGWTKSKSDGPPPFAADMPAEGSEPTETASETPAPAHGSGLSKFS
jgi:hypothetical protein